MIAPTTSSCCLKPPTRSVNAFDLKIQINTPPLAAFELQLQHLQNLQRLQHFLCTHAKQAHNTNRIASHCIALHTQLSHHQQAAAIPHLV
jgi:hypothetical protein